MIYFVKQFLNKFFFSNIFILLFISIYIIPNHAVSKPLETKLWINIKTKESFYEETFQNSIQNNSFGFQTSSNINNIKSKLVLNFDSKKKIKFDQSFIELKKSKKIFGFGKINRNWSFSPNTSLVLTTNARQTNSIYFTYDSKQASNNLLLKWAGPLSFEAFNAFKINTNKINDSMLLGMRAVIEPIHDLKFELIKTSQWGGDGKNKNLSSFVSSVIGNTNEKKYSDINQLAGFGISFQTNIKNNPLRFYTQSVGEDEAGNLPTCFINLIGSELELNDGKLFSSLGIEYIDTRTYKSTHGNCGKNASYNNNIYSYTHNGNALGTLIRGALVIL